MRTLAGCRDKRYRDLRFTRCANPLVVRSVAVHAERDDGRGRTAKQPFNGILVGSCPWVSSRNASPKVSLVCCTLWWGESVGVHQPLSYGHTHFAQWCMWPRQHRRLVLDAGVSRIFEHRWTRSHVGQDWRASPLGAHATKGRGCRQRNSKRRRVCTDCRCAGNGGRNPINKSCGQILNAAST